MARVLKREAAKRDFIDLWVWYADNASIDVADRFLAAADNTLHLLSTQPESGALFFVHKRELRGMRRVGVSDGFEKILVKPNAGASASYWLLRVSFHALHIH